MHLMDAPSPPQIPKAPRPKLVRGGFPSGVTHGNLSQIPDAYHPKAAKIGCLEGMSAIIVGFVGLLFLYFMITGEEKSVKVAPPATPATPWIEDALSLIHI